jgi:hypothetical protein
MHVAVPVAMKMTRAGMGAVLLMLVVTGVAGTVYKIVTPNGWIADAFQRSTTAGLAVIGTLGLLGLFAWVSRGAVRQRNRQSSVFVYAFAAAGLVYLTRFWIHGSL